ncbi:S41 family peptidase [Lentisphaerota bacterium WC36G]|nr:S41 family peptidase [Lentisphaerae bacterium WC36]
MSKFLSSLIVGVGLSLNIFANQEVATNEKKQKEIVLPKLNKQQMVEDFDFLIKTFKGSYPKFDIAKDIYGIDMIKILEKHKKRITGNETPSEFVKILTNAISQCKADHFGFAPVKAYSVGPAKKHRPWFKNLVKEEDYDITQAYIKLFRAQRKNEKKIHFPLYYKNKNLYLMFDIFHNGQKLPADIKLISCFGQPTLELLKKNQNKFHFYDSENKLFYCENNFLGKIFDKNFNSSIITFEDKNGKKYNYDTTKRLVPPKSFLASIPFIGKVSRKGVKYIPKNKLLIVRIPAMTYGDIQFYEENIIKEAANKKIDAIILDIRGNGGGGDDVWKSILKNIIEKPVKFKINFAYRKGGLVEIYLKDRFGEDWKTKHKLMKVPYLKNVEYWINDKDITIKPSEKSLNFTGPIFIFCQDNYSSASSLAIHAKANPRFTTIGPKNNIDVGAGINPMIFSLPNSRMMLTFGCDTDLSYCNNVEDTMHLNTNIELERFHYQLNYLKALNKAPKDLNNEQKLDWLYNQFGEIDPHYKKALELMKTSKK